MIDDSIKPESGSGITVGGKTLEEYLDDEYNSQFDIPRAARDSFIPYSPKRTDKRQRGAKARYYIRKRTHIYTKQEIYKEYMGKFLMELSKIEAPLSKLVIQCLISGDKKTIRDVVTDITTSMSTTAKVNFGSVSSVFYKIVRSNLGPFVIEFWKKSRLIALQMAEGTEDLKVEDANKLYANEMSLDDVSGKYPNLKDLLAKCNKVENGTENMDKAEDFNKQMFEFVKDQNLTHKVIAILLSDCGSHTSATIGDKLKEIFGLDLSTTKVSGIINRILGSNLGQLIKRNAQFRPIMVKFIFSGDDDVALEDMLEMYKKRGTFKYSDIKDKYPKVWAKLKKQEIGNGEEVSAKNIGAAEVRDEVNSTVHELIEGAIKKALQGSSALGSGQLDVKVSGGINISFTFNK